MTSESSPDPPAPPERSKFVPTVQAILVCDAATADASQKKSLIGIFDQLGAPGFPTQRSVSLYVRLGSAFGRYEFSFRLVNAATWENATEIKATAEVAERNSRIDFLLPQVPVVFPTAGSYEFQVWANDAYLGCATIDAIQMDEKPS